MRWVLGLSLALWLALWAALNADPNPDALWPSTAAGARAFLPIAAGAFGVLALAARGEHRAPVPGVVVALLAVAGAGLLASFLYSPAPALAAHWGLAYAAAPVVAWALLTRADPRGIILSHRLNVAVAGLLAFLFVIVSVWKFGLLEHVLAGRIVRLYDPMPDLGFLSANSNGVGRFAGVTFLILVVQALAAQRPAARWAWAAACAPLALLLLYTVSRSSLVGVAACTLLAILLVKGPRAAALSGLAAAVLFLVLSPAMVDYLGRGQDAAELLAISNRSPAWAAAWAAFTQSPFIGQGFHADRILLDGLHVHNAWLHALLQSGVVGGTAFALAWALGGRAAFRLLRRRSSVPRAESILFVELAVLLAFFGTRSLVESTGAFFGVDLLFVVPILCALVSLDARSLATDRAGVPTFPLAGARVSATTMRGALDFAESAIIARRQEHVLLSTVNMLVTAQKDPKLREALDAAGLVLCDGMPLYRLGRRRTSGPIERTRGTDYTIALCELAARRGYRVYLYGGADGVPERMAEVLRQRFPGLQIVGTHSPPFRALSHEEDAAEVARINATRPDIIFVGLGCPKQEKWALAHRGRVEAPLLVCVGAAFDFIAGTKKDAPRFLQGNFEAIWRFSQEPTRLWRRVIVEPPKFFALVAWEALVGRGRA